MHGSVVSDGSYMRAYMLVTCVIGYSSIPTFPEYSCSYV